MHFIKKDRYIAVCVHKDKYIAVCVNKDKYILVSPLESKFNPCNQLSPVLLTLWCHLALLEQVDNAWAYYVVHCLETMLKIPGLIFCGPSNWFYWEIFYNEREVCAQEGFTELQTAFM